MALSQRDIRNTIEQATSVIVEPFYSVDSKIETVNAIGALDAPEALALLMRALEMVAYPLDARQDTIEAWFKATEHPRAGKLSKAAALALARHSNSEGLAYIISILSDTNNNAWLKDCAAFALSGHTESKSIDALLLCLRDKHAGVRLAAVRALDLSLAKLSDQDRTPILLELFMLACHNFFPEEPAKADLSAELARQTFRIYRTPALDLDLISYIPEMEHDHAARIGTEMIGENLSNEGAIGLAFLLKSDSRSPEEYIVIGKLLRNCKAFEVRQIAEQVLVSKNYLNTFLGLISSEVRSASAERLKAARMVLGGSV